MGKRKSKLERARELQQRAAAASDRSLLATGHLIPIPPTVGLILPPLPPPALRRRVAPSSPIEAASSPHAAAPEPIERASSEPPPPPPPSEAALAAREGLHITKYGLPDECAFAGDEHLNAVADVVAGLVTDSRLRWWTADARRAEFLLLHLQQHMHLYDPYLAEDLPRRPGPEQLARIRKRLVEVDREIRVHHPPRTGRKPVIKQ